MNKMNKSECIECINYIDCKMKVKMSVGLIVLILLFCWQRWYRSGSLQVLPFAFGSDSHLGCYERTNRNHSSAIQSLWRQIEVNRRPHSTAIHPYSEQGVKVLAVAVEKYLEESYKANSLGEFQHDYQYHLNQVYKAFLKCQSQVDYFDVASCKKKWKEYSQGKEQYGKIEKKLSVLGEEKGRIEAQIREMLERKKPRPHDPLTYYSEINQIEKRNAQLELKINTFKHIRRQNQTQIISKKRELRQINDILEECVRNAALVADCKEMEKVVREMPSWSTNYVSLLHRKIVQLREKIREMQNKKGSVLFDSKVYEETITQLQFVERSYKSVNGEEEAMCARCRSELLTEYRVKVRELEGVLRQLEVEISKASIQIGRDEKEVEENERKIEELRKEIDRWVIDDKEDDKPTAEEIEKINEIKVRLNEKIKQVVDLKKEFIDRLYIHQDSKSQIDQYYKKTVKIANCIHKKQYYEKIKAQQSKEKGKEDGRVKKSKQSVVRELTNLEL